MRIVGMIAAVMAGSWAVPGAAQTAATPADDPSRIAAPPPPLRPSAPQPLALAGASQREARITARLRLRVATVASATGLRDTAHQRLAGSMIDLYPVDGSGFHLSAGTRVHDQRAGESAASRKLVRAARQINVPGGRSGARRTPAVTLGYRGTVDEDTSIAVEVGAMKGHVYSSATDMTRRLRGERGEGNPVNPMVHLVLGLRF
jgi:hypothetical protein